MNMYTVAHELGVPVGQVREMPVEDFLGHLAYIQIRLDRRSGKPRWRGRSR